MAATKTGVSLNWGGFDKALGKAAHKLGDTQALMESVGDALVSGTLKRFQDEEDPTGKKWPKSKRAAKKDGQTLTDTALLRRSVDYAATSDKVMVGSNLPYARIHQKGGKTGKGHKVDMPARPYLGVSEEDMDEVRETVADFLAGTFKA
ncbi:phage virion morphogenesis protein [Bilophila wadsworthia]|uniref:phage virion morphogenesis protein n=1 Tax=Bilophila wadsworthia TaxID=35833 RepID=UPI001D327119|nr:phage virion morphogenesis protein [Bilophila wadsworthia]MBS5375465.1 phage virion morphogenesis protein [Bilophila wadsworthia]MCI6540515.1 phage virion morphogenesis protein [Bilophila wadsworthia]